MGVRNLIHFAYIDRNLLHVRKDITQKASLGIVVTELMIQDSPRTYRVTLRFKISTRSLACFGVLSSFRFSKLGCESLGCVRCMRVHIINLTAN